MDNHARLWLAQRLSWTKTLFFLFPRPLLFGGPFVGKAADCGWCGSGFASWAGLTWRPRPLRCCRGPGTPRHCVPATHSAAASPAGALQRRPPMLPASACMPVLLVVSWLWCRRGPLFLDAGRTVIRHAGRVSHTHAGQHEPEAVAVALQARPDWHSPQPHSYARESAGARAGSTRTLLYCSVGMIAADRTR